jgi:hypothetical protein
MRRATAWCGLIEAEDAVPSPFFACSHSVRVQRRGESYRAERKLGVGLQWKAFVPFPFLFFRSSPAAVMRVCGEGATDFRTRSNLVPR